MTQASPADTLHRLVKEALDSGSAATISEAEQMFRGYRVHFSIGADEVKQASHQASLLTGVALARRVFLGGVSVSGDLNTPLLVPMPLGKTLREAVASLGAVKFDHDCPTDTPLIAIGGPPWTKRSGFGVRTECAGWRGGIVPLHSSLSPSGPEAMPLAAMLAAALAVSEAFFFVRSGSTAAGRKSVGLSLWRPAEQGWLAPHDDEPELCYLPSRLWLIGLGHLGQAYLWALGLLPYGNPKELSLVLQDVDLVTPSTESTSVLTNADMVGLKKTRVMAAWAERRGFQTTIQERLFAVNFRRQPDEPPIALCGLDNAVGRRALGSAGFDLVVEAGLGRGHRDFRTMRLHTLPGMKTPEELWPDAPSSERVPTQPGYEDLIANGVVDQCGATLLAGKAVGAPFVGAVAATLAVSEVLRLLHDGVLHHVIDADLLSLEQRSVVRHSRDWTSLNPGVTAACRVPSDV